jgi:hypothetical protein
VKAARFDRFGGPEQVKVEEIDRPVPKKGEALVRVCAAGVNPVDWMKKRPKRRRSCVRSGVRRVRGVCRRPRERSGPHSQFHEF